MGEELGINASTVCKCVREYRRKNGLSSPVVAHSTEPASKEADTNDAKRKLEKLEKRLKQKDKELTEEQENVKILKKTCPSLCEHAIEMRGYKHYRIPSDPR